MLAEDCDPENTSVALVGFKLYESVSRVADVTLVTHVRARPALERQFGGTRRIEFIDSEALAAPAYKIGNLLTLWSGLGWTTRSALMWAPYLYFEHLVWKRFRRELQAGAFNLIHRVTPISPTYPSPIACWSRLPFIIGPLNGGLPWPKGTQRVRWAEMEWLSYLRGAHKLLPYVRATYSRAAKIICGSRCTMASLPRSAAHRAIYLPENGIDPERFHAIGRERPSVITPFRILFVGRLVPYKGAHHVIQALADSPILRERAELVIVGEGPERRRLTRMSAALAIGGRVIFAGALPQAKVAQMLRESSVFVFPSIREFGGAVVLEAMACGAPPIAIDYGGPGELMTPGCGIALPVTDPRGMSSRLRTSLEELLAAPNRLDSMSAAGAERAREFTWDVKAGRIRQIYDDVLGRTSWKPRR